jgi:hypothetical protein
MVFKGFIERDVEPSFAERFSNAMSGVVSGAAKEYGNYRKNKQAEAEKTSKKLADLSAFLPKEFKARGRGSLAEDPRQLAMFR